MQNCECEQPLIKCDGRGCHCTLCGLPERLQFSTQANDRQVGGSHYRSAYQHWDFVEECGLGYLEGCATKYVSRWRGKNGLEDLKKAAHYLEKLIELNTAGKRESRHFHTGDNVHRFCYTNGFGSLEYTFVTTLATWTDANDLSQAQFTLRGLIVMAQQEHDREADVDPKK